MSLKESYKHEPCPSLLSAIPSFANQTISLSVIHAPSQFEANRLIAPNEVRKFILLLLNAKAAAPIPGLLWLQKEIFLLQDIFPSLAEQLDFEPYPTGPHSEIVANELEELRRSNLLMTGGNFCLTERGKIFANYLLQITNQREIQKIEEFKELLNGLSKDELLAFIYFSYPVTEIEKESVEYKRILLKRIKIALSLYEKDKISAQKAAQIAGENLQDFIESYNKVMK